MTTEPEMAEQIHDALAEYEGFARTSTESFEEAGVMSNNTGLVIRTDDGSEFQVTIVQSK